MSDLQTFKCPCCGNALQWDAASQKVKCQYCDSEFDIETLKQDAQSEQDTTENVDSAAWNTNGASTFSSEEEDHLKHYICQNCGGEIITDETTAATTCPYCDSNVVLNENVSGTIKPNAVLPFILQKEEAKEKYKEHLKGKPLLPADFMPANKIDEIKGVYVPFFMFDGDAEGRMRFRASRSRRCMNGDYEITETEYYSVFRSGAESFAHIPVGASTKVTNQLMQSLEPFDYSKLMDFNSAYLAGYLADKFDVGVDQCKPEANRRIANTLEMDLRSTIIGYDTVMPVSRNISISNPNISYVLLPIWLLNSTYKGKKYTFAMNGQSGKFVGNLPVDWGKLIGYFAAIFVGVALFVMLVIVLAMK